ncbi:TPA: hypothetical protein RG678_002507 [Vibrio alginolyticus]|uniref:hypothetical protein n=1 Tax=Vibrio TaxID=662 RepID=UPI001BD24DFD|nr:MULTISPECIES: hypothetical protein [Vibrio]EGQ8040645.1 hypothetical protein [Vibrio alginolyticus]EJL6782053.1 hypothetical protein [Vibrio alginolyticus]ELB2786024.1 hypothetical protein [Vibrio alginolyticus]MBS9905385.1 hypothetical protein [Vibrio alginolyticus]MBS9932186.1 hypothetical protein [Vibrio alginolyticus]
MRPMKQETLSYFDDLNYSVMAQMEEVDELKQNRTGSTVELNFSVLGKGELPAESEQRTDKKLYFIDIEDIERIGFEALEPFVAGLGEHCSMVVFEEEFFEQSMKEVWMFLSNDPHDRDVFNDSKFYRA